MQYAVCCNQSVHLLQLQTRLPSKRSCISFASPVKLISSPSLVLLIHVCMDPRESQTHWNTRLPSSHRQGSNILSPTLPCSLRGAVLLAWLARTVAAATWLADRSDGPRHDDNLCCSMQPPWNWRASDCLPCIQAGRPADRGPIPHCPEYAFHLVRPTSTLRPPLH